MKLEALSIPVSDVDRAKRFYESLGWRVDADFDRGEAFRAVQMTPPGSACSIQFGRNISSSKPGSAERLLLVVDDLEAARAQLKEAGVDVSESFHHADVTGPRLPGPHPDGGSYRSWASFRDPDGNEWLIQEVKERLPGRGLGLDVATLTELLREAEGRHGQYEPTARKHHWSAWYAAYIVARVRGRTPEEAAEEAKRRIEAAEKAKAA
jgi:catechol 2,3-dioxygenase-like lactoylglutathione lyase family enzyme